MLSSKFQHSGVKISDFSDMEFIWRIFIINDSGEIICDLTKSKKISSEVQIKYFVSMALSYLKFVKMINKQKGFIVQNFRLPIASVLFCF